MTYDLEKLGCSGTTEQRAYGSQLEPHQAWEASSTSTAWNPDSPAAPSWLFLPYLLLLENILASLGF